MRTDRGKLNFDQINQDILINHDGYLTKWLPGGRFRGNEYIVCNPRRYDKNPGSFTINRRTGKWADFATGDCGTTPLGLYAYLCNLDYLDACHQFLSDNRNAYIHSTTTNKRKCNSGYKHANANKDFALKLWNNSYDPCGTVVEAYLRSRGITINIPKSVRFLSGHKHRPSGRTYPAMIAAVRSSSSQELIAIHRTWLRPDGMGKAPIEPVKMMLGSTKGGAVQISPPNTSLIIAEGIETALTVKQETGQAIWACLSTSGMTSLVLPDLPLAQEITIAADNDPAGRNAASQAAESWSKQGRTVRIALPPEGKDFNDMICHGVANA